MKYVVDLTGKNVKYKFPQQGDKVYIKPPLSEESSTLENMIGSNYLNPVKNPSKFTHIVHVVNNEGNEAGFGWVWLYNPKTHVYEYKMSILDRRIIPGDTEVPNVGFDNSTAYEIIQLKETVQTGTLLTFWNYLKGLFK